jgi:small-conductance mechanosensitive channel
MFYGNDWSAWLIAAGVGIAVLAGLTTIRWVAGTRLAALARRTDNDYDDVVASVVERTRPFFLLAAAIYAASNMLVLPSPARRIIDAIAVVALVVQGALWGNAAITQIVKRQVRRRAAEDAAGATTVSALGFLGRVALWSVLLLLGLDNLGVDITALVAGLGISGIAVALALQNVLGDLFASLAIVLDKPFVLGDFIIVDELMGTVEYVGLKTTRVRSLSGEQIVFANADLLDSRIRNFKRMYERRVVFGLGVTYDTPRETMVRIPTMIREIVEAQEGVRFDRAHFKAYGAFSLDIEVVYYVLSPDFGVYMDAQQAINLEIMRSFEAEEIEFAFPTQTLHLHRVSSSAVPA